MDTVLTNDATGAVRWAAACVLVGRWEWWLWCLLLFVRTCVGNAKLLVTGLDDLWKAVDSKIFMYLVRSHVGDVKHPKSVVEYVGLLLNRVSLPNFDKGLLKGVVEVCLAESLRVLVDSDRDFEWADETWVGDLCPDIFQQGLHVSDSERSVALVARASVVVHELAARRLERFVVYGADVGDGGAPDALPVREAQHLLCVEVFEPQEAPGGGRAPVCDGHKVQKWVALIEGLICQFPRSGEEVEGILTTPWWLAMSCLCRMMVTARLRRLSCIASSGRTISPSLKKLHALGGEVASPKPAISTLPCRRERKKVSCLPVLGWNGSKKRSGEVIGVNVKEEGANSA